ncbi:MAG: nucleoside monophosphate kinase, partial [Silvanigrellaceae bacterium]|nr:nucleoside monophosphate kinase [Silvanigrellaceae bacterium]
ILTGPSSCGKGEVANALSKVLSIPHSFHLSMGDILRTTFQKAKEDESYAQLLESNYHISKSSNIFDCIDTSEELAKKVKNYLPEMEKYFKRSNMVSFTSQLEWLEFCTMNGLLVPNRWTQCFIASHIEHTTDFRTQPFILDGYPRTVEATKHLMALLKSLKIPVIKVLHLSISKQEMLSRAVKRGRADDDEQSLLSRYQFYIENVQPSVDYLKMELGSDVIALIDAHQPVFDSPELGGKFNLKKSILKVVSSSLRSLGVPRVTVKDLMMKL